MLFNIDEDRYSTLNWIVIAVLTKYGITEYIRESGHPDQKEIKLTIDGCEMDIEHLCKRIDQEREHALEEAEKKAYKQGREDAIAKITENMNNLFDWSEEE